MIGLVIGLVIVAFMFSDRDWDGWTPNSQVLQKAMDYYQEPSAEVMCQMECLGVDISTLKGMMEDGDVEFDESQVKGKIKMYHIEHELPDGRELYTKWEFEELSLEKMTATLMEMGPNTECDCE